jgi:hypothetical protein
MSTYQPPGGPPQGPSGYVPPQDPWAVPEHGGLASMPTDPIPQQYEQPRYEQPQYPTGSEVWSQQPTVAHGGQYAPPMAPVPQRNRAGMLVIIFVAVLVLGGGGVYAGFYFVKKHGSNTPTTTQTDLQSVQVGDCLVNVGTDNDPDMRRSACTAANSFKAVKVVRGDAVPRDSSSGVVDPKAAAGVVCAGTKYENFYAYWDTEAPAHNVVICLVANVGSGTSPTAAS